MKYLWATLFVCLMFVGCGDTKKPSISEKESSPTAADSTPESESDEESPSTETSSKKTTEPTKSEAQMAFDAIEKEFTDEREAFIEKLRALPENEQREFVQNNAPKPDVYADRFMKLAEDFPDDPAAVDALVWVAQSPIGGELEERAFSILTEKHFDKENVGDLCFSLMYGPPEAKTVERLETFIEKSPHDEVKAKMTFALASHYMSNRDKIDVEEDKIVSLFENLESEYGKYKIHERSKKTLADMAKSSIFELQNLSIGKVAPEIEGEDLEGVEFKLSDYRGKVVVLDFWGDW